MRKIHMLTLGDYQTNCYILHEESARSCCVIDPGYTPEIVEDKLRELGLTLEAILLTHGHFDHVGGVRQLAADTGCAVYLCTADLAMPARLTGGPLYYTKAYGEGDRLHLAGLDIDVIQTPGHTPGSVCLLVEDVLFAGDTLFAGSCGRYDLAGADGAAMKRSLARLAALETDYWVLPGHGESTTLAREKQYNPYMRQLP